MDKMLKKSIIERGKLIEERNKLKEELQKVTKRKNHSIFDNDF